MGFATYGTYIVLQTTSLYSTYACLYDPDVYVYVLWSQVKWIACHYPINNQN